MTTVYREPPDHHNVACVEVGNLTEPAAAKFLGICPRTLFKLRKAGTGPRHVRIGKSVRYPRHLLVEWLDARAEVGATT